MALVTLQTIFQDALHADHHESRRRQKPPAIGGEPPFSGH